MKIFIFFSFLIFSANKVTAQKITYYHHENMDMVFIKCKNPPFFGSDSLALRNYLSNHLKDVMSKTNGRIEISVVIDTTGKVYCRSIINNSDLNVDKVRLVSVIESLPPWNVGLQNGHKVNCLVKINL